MIKSEHKGSAILAAYGGEYDVIAQGCNCFQKQKRGFALAMVEAFQTDQFVMELDNSIGPQDRLGNIDHQTHHLKNGKNIWICNMYTQYHYKDLSPYGIPLDYDAIRLCFRKANIEWMNCEIIVPGLIGCGLAGGNPEIVRKIINEETTRCNVHVFTL